MFWGGLAWLQCLQLSLYLFEDHSKIGFLRMMQII